MKYFYPVLVLFTLVTFTQCSSDDNDNDNNQNNNTENGFTYKNEFYPTETFGLFYVEGNQLAIEITDAIYDPTMFCFSGNDKVFLDLFVISTESGDLGAGEYTYQIDPTEAATFEGEYESFVVGIDYGNCEASTSPQEAPAVIGGTLSVGRNGDNYTINYDLNLDNGEDLVGSYSGTRDYFRQD